MAKQTLISTLAIRLTFNSQQVQTGVRQAGRGMGKLNERAEQMNQRFGRTNRQLVDFDKGLAGIRGKLAGFTKGLLAASAAFFTVNAVLSNFRKQMDRLEGLDLFAQRIGDTVENLSILEVQARLTRIPMATLQTAMQRMTRRISEAAIGTGVAVKTLDEMGLSARRLNMMTPTEQLVEFSRAIVQSSTQGDKLRQTIGLMDTEGAALVPLLERIGTVGFGGMRREAEELNAVVRDELLPGMRDAATEMEKAAIRMDAAWQTFTLQTAPGVSSVLEWLAGGLQNISDIATEINLIWNNLRAGTNVWRRMFGQEEFVRQDRAMREEYFTRRGMNPRGAELDKKIADANKRLAEQARQAAKKEEMDSKRRDRILQEMNERGRRQELQPPVVFEQTRL